MDTIDQVSNALIWLIRVGALFRVTYCAFRLVSADDEAARFKKRAVHTLVFYLIAESAWVVKTLVLSYYTGGG